MADVQEHEVQLGFRADDRQESILEKLDVQKKVTVVELAKDFGVSAVTIRSDLDILERQGKLKRVRGGAIIYERMRDVADMSKRMAINADRKKTIAQLANTLVSDGDSIIVDSGSTAFEFAKTLGNKRDITVLTADINIALWVDGNVKSASVILLGGTLRPQHDYCWGPLLINMIEQIHVDKAFLGTNGFVSEQGFMTEHPYASQTKTQYMAHSRQKIMLMDSTKIEIPSFMRFASISDMDYIVMDGDPDGVMAHAIADLERPPIILLP